MPRIKIENKHRYLGVSTTIDGNVLAPTSTAVRQVNGWIRYFEPSYPTQGTDEDDRIGRKIMTTSLISEGFISLRTGNVENSLGDVYDGFISELKRVGGWAENYELSPEMFPVKASIRHMFVEFDPDVIAGSNANQYDLFRQWFTSLNIQNGTDLMPSNQTLVRRESTAWTGKFKILHDNIYNLTFKNPQFHFHVKLPYKHYLNFDSTTEQTSPTNRRLFEIFIGPANVHFDYGIYSFGDHLLATSTAEANFILRLANLNHTLKLNYIDV